MLHPPGRIQHDNESERTVQKLFSGETGVKPRPAVVVSSSAYHEGRQEATIAAVTSNVERLLVGDHLLSG